MRFKFFIIIFFPFCLFATPGYHLPWGKDADVVLPSYTPPPPQGSLAVRLAKQVILFHQKVLSPVDGPRSHFYPCSSQYMKLAMTKYGFVKGFIKGCDRLMREDQDPWIYRKIQINGKWIKYDPP